jgi:hypothetical protein
MLYNVLQAFSQLQGGKVEPHELAFACGYSRAAVNAWDW